MDDFDLSQLKNIELDKICRVCLAVKKDMRPLFGELIAEMLMEVARVQIEQLDGWPDKICLHCIHQISKFAAFKTRVEKSDQKLRDYIKGITVVVETIPAAKEMTIAQIEIPREIKTHQQHVQAAAPQIQEIQIQRSDLHNNSGQMIVTSAQLLNSSAAAQLLNSGQIVTTTTGQQIIQAPQIVQGQIGQLIHGPNNTVQMITTPSGAQAQVVQIQRASDVDGRCEIIVQPSELGETQYFEDVVVQTQSTVSEGGEDVDVDEQIIDDVDDQYVLTAEIAEVSEGEIEESDTEEKQYLAEFMTYQTTCRDNVHICNLCHKEFKNIKWLQSHMKSHSNWIKANCKKLPECEICHKSFRGPGMLKMHMKVHDPKVISCSVCNKEFRSKSILYRHRQTHFEKQHTCNICSKTFSSNYQLNNHLARHRGEKSHKCQHCEKAYYSATDLKNHMQLHLGLKNTKKMVTTNG